MEANFEEKILNDVKKQICPLLEDEIVLDALQKIFTSTKAYDALNSIKNIQPLIMNIAQKQKIKNEKTVLDILMYLFEVEVSANFIVDVLIMLLSVKGKVFHIEPDDKHYFIRHATSIEDLQSPSVTLGMKLNFLKRNDLGCVKKYVDNTLRNNIAHMNFKIDEEGNFLKNEYGKEKQVDIWDKLIKLIQFNSTVIHQMNIMRQK